MEVLRGTYLESLPLIKQAIEESDFVAIDTEFTGLFTRKNKISQYDDLGLRYSKLRDAAQAFRVVQFGLAAFRYEAEEGSGGVAGSPGRWVSRTFNFYIFTDENDENSGESAHRVFSCQPSSLLFLSESGFDFNKLLQQGIPYASVEDITKRKAKKEARAALPDIPIDDSNKEFYENARNLVDDWLQNLRGPELSVPCPSSYHRRLVYQLLRADVYVGRLVVSKGDGGDIIMKRLTDEMKSQLDELGEETKPNFSDVLEMIAVAGKPVVGHNCLLDFCFTIAQFREELPDTLPAFKKSLKRFWHTVVDTKHIATMDPSVREMIGLEGSTILGPLYEQTLGNGFENAPSIVMAPSFGRYTGEHVEAQRLHEAGYDAYCTGAVFIRLAWLIAGGQDNAAGKIDFGHPNIAPYVNRLYVMQSDAQWISLDGPDDGTLFLRWFPKLYSCLRRRGWIRGPRALRSSREGLLEAPGGGAVGIPDVEREPERHSARNEGLLGEASHVVSPGAPFVTPLGTPLGTPFGTPSASRVQVSNAGQMRRIFTNAARPSWGTGFPPEVRRPWPLPPREVGRTVRALRWLLR